MTESFSKNRNWIFLYFLGIVFSIGFLNAQNKEALSNIEKVYLHTDRSTYFMGEDLWYKAYNVRAINNLLFDNSNILYVELISSDSKIIARNKTNLEMGLGHGDFQLQDSLDVKPGIYQLRAYTNWNRNFGDDFVFKKEIEIVDVFESNDKSKTTQKNALETKITKKETINQNTFHFDFFPEGGSLLENVASVVGFKSVDNNGKPIDVSGEIYDSNNELISNFKSSHDGMGKFQFLPIEGETYYAKIKNLTEEEIKIELPKVTKLGYLLNFRTFKGKSIVTISTNQATLVQNPNAQFRVVCKARGIPYLETTQTLSETTFSFELPKDKTPEGISQITLFDNTNKPQSERLFYIEKDYDLEVQLETDKATYEPDEKVTINVSSKSKEGIAKSASFSLSVTDMNGQEEENNLDSNISSYFLMESDIRGKVNKPAYYFDTTNPKRLEHLDNLLLTQGWRDFVWKTIPKANDSINYKVEKGITISGRVKQLLADKPLVNNNLTLALTSKKNRNIFSAVTDSVGKFQFENLMFSGKTNMYLNTRDKKGKFRGEIVLDSIEQAPMPIKFKKEIIDFSDADNSFAENVLKKFIAFGVKPGNVLKEVEIVAKNKSRVPVFYGIADDSYVPDESIVTFIDIYDLILQKIHGVISDGDSVRFQRFRGGPLFLLNSHPAFKAEIDNIQLSDVEKIDAVKGAQATLYYGEQGENGIIAIYTKPNTGNRPKKDPYQSIKKELEGFYTARVFYSPDSDKPSVELDKKTAVRNTIYWNPYVHPDKSGNAVLNYFNSGIETKVKLALEGITSNGIPVIKNVYYTIKK